MSQPPTSGAESQPDDPTDHSKEFYRRQFKIQFDHKEKLLQLLLLTDPAVSNVEMNKLTERQWAEYERWRKEKHGGINV